MHIALIGLRGSGKSTSGRLLAERIGWAFYDTDQMLQERAGKSIREIFAQDGEPHFRDLEAECVALACQSAQAVIATGGGAILRADNVTLLKNGGFIVHLAASPQELWRRVQGDPKSAQERPALLPGGGASPSYSGEEELTQLMLKRASAYANARDAEVDVEERTPLQIVEAVHTLCKVHRPEWWRRSSSATIPVPKTK